MAAGIPADRAIVTGLALMLLFAQITVNVDLVVVHATVRDHKGEFVADLTQQDFRVFEDGARQTIRIFQHEDGPVTVGLVIDHSGSMRHKLADVITAARTFIGSSNPEDQMFVVNFNERVTLGLPSETRFSSSADELTGAIATTAVEGQTALYDAVASGLRHLESGSAHKKVLIVISDGGDNRSSQTLAGVLKMAEQTSTLIYAIGIYEADDPDHNPGVLRSLTRATGGEAYFPRRTSDVVGDCERIAHDIRHQYTIGYVSSHAAQPGAHRSVRVTAGKLVVRARSGYVTPESK